MNYTFLVRAGLAALCLLSICAPVSAQSVTTVHMRDSTFDPQSVTVHVGDTVAFSNDDQITHNVTGDVLKSGDLDPGKTWRYTFTKAGTYNYVCTYHSWMKGTITAVAGDNSSSSPDEH